MAVNILYEDNHLIAVYKPAGVLVQGDKTGDATLMDEVKYYLKQKYHKPGNVFLGLLHRLDRPVAGIILFAKTSKGASRLSEQFRSHKITKIYHALVEGTLKENRGTLLHYLKKDRERNMVKVYERAVPESQRAELDYEVVEIKQNQSIVKIILKTGRSHQIRSQFAYIGHPIVGDVKYGADTVLKKGRIELVSTEMGFGLVTKKDIMSLLIQLPVEWVN